MALKITSDGGCQLNDEDKTIIMGQLIEARGPTNITFSDSGLLVQMVGSVISSYPVEGDNISYMSSVQPLRPYPVSARITFSPPTSARPIPLIPLLKIARCRMTA